MQTDLTKLLNFKLCLGMHLFMLHYICKNQIGTFIDLLKVSLIGFSVRKMFSHLEVTLDI